MRMELEHGDVIKALAVYMQTKGFVVAPEYENFVFKNESTEPGKIELLVLVKNMDTAPPEPAAPPPVQRPAAPTQRATGQAQAAPVSRPAPRPAPSPTPPKKNDMFRPVAPPQLIPPAPKHRVLDKQAASSPALMIAGQHPHMPMAAAVVPAYGGSEKGAEELVDDYVSPPVRRPPVVQTDSSLIVDPNEMAPEDRAVFDDILARSQARAEEGPHYATDSADDPIRPEGHVEDE